MRSDFASDPELADMEVLQNCRQATDVILVCMRQRHNVQLLKSPRPQIRRHGLFAWIDAIVFFVTGKTSECAAPINQKCFAARRYHKKRVALANIEDRHFQLSLCPLLSEGINCNRD